jgi:hypothetical protein
LAEKGAINGLVTSISHTGDSTVFLAHHLNIIIILRSFL